VKKQFDKEYAMELNDENTNNKPREKLPPRAEGFILNEDLDEEEKEMIVQSNLV